MLLKLIFWFNFLVTPVSLIILQLTGEFSLLHEQPEYKDRIFVLTASLVIIVGLYLSAYNVKVARQIKHIVIAYSATYAVYDVLAETARQSNGGGFGIATTFSIYVFLYALVFYSLLKIEAK